ncbi:MAG: hypothetical protein ACXQTW_06065 [Candidatus Methanospirareceae archaeon]
MKLRQVRREALDNYLEVLKVLEERIEEMNVEMYGFTKKERSGT